MRTRKLFAWLLAVLMLASTVIVPTGAAEATDTTAEHPLGVVTYYFTTTTDSEKAYYDPSLLVGTEQTQTTGNVNWSGRYADGSRFFGYAFPITGDTMPTAVQFHAQMRGDLLVQVSVDKTNWVTAFTATATTPTWRQLDLTDAFTEALNGGTADTLYLRFGDSKPSDGGGTNVLWSHEAKMIMDYSTGTVRNGTTVTYGFAATGLAEPQYLDATIGVGSISTANIKKPEHHGRYKDQGYYGYSFPLEDTASAPETATFSAMMRGDILVEVSVDKENWIVAYTKPDDEDQRDNRAWRDIDLTAALQQAWGASMPTHVYLRFGDLVKDGWGTNIQASNMATLTLNYPADAKFLVKNEVVHTFTPTQNHSTEAAYFHPLSSSLSNSVCHFADDGRKLIYAFDMTTTEMPSKLEATFATSGQLELSVSTDNYHWVTAYAYEGAANDSGLAKGVRTFDLLSAYQTAYAANASNMLYIRFGDSYKPGGYGGTLQFEAPFTLRIGYSSYVEGLSMINYESTINGTADDKYYVSGGNVAGTSRFADRDGFVLMMYPITGVGESESVLLTMSATQQLLLQVSVDNANWVDAFRYSDIGYLAAHANDADHKWYFFPRKERTFDLTGAVKAAAEACEQAGTSESGLYVRWGDAHPVRVNADGTEMARTEQGFNAGAGWGGNVTGKVVLSMAQTAGLGAVADDSRVTLSTVVPNENGSFTLIGQEPMLVTDPGVMTGNLSNNLGAGKVTANADGTYTFSGDGNYNGRFADNNNYFVYRYQIPAAANTMVWSAQLGGGYGVDLAIGGEACPAPNDASLWETVALYSEDGLNGTNQSIAKTITYDLSDVDVSAGDKYVYLKFYDADAANSGYGPRIALGSNYFVTMAWEVSLEDDIKNAGLAGVSFNFTDSINMVFYPTLPLSTTEVKAEIEYAGQTPVELTVADNGTYTLDGIISYDLATPFTFRLTGKAGDAADFTYEKEISPKQVALDMIEAYKRDEALVTLLEDMLVYGAAASVVTGGENWLADTTITQRDFKPYMLGSFYSQLTYGEKKGTAEFTDCEVIFREDCYLNVTFTAPDVTNVKIRLVSNIGEVVYFDADDFTSNGGTTYSLILPTGLYDLGKMQTLCFVENDVALTDYYMPISANNSIANLYETSDVQSSTALAAFVASLYQLGESMYNYVESIAR